MSQAVAGTMGGQSGEARSGRPFWREALAPYAKPKVGRSLLDLATSVVPYLALSYLMYLTLSVSYLLVLAIAVPAAGFLLRTYIVFHDCTHGSFLPSKRGERVAGCRARAARLRAVPALAARPRGPPRHLRRPRPPRRRRRADADRRPSTTRCSWRERLGYRLFRNPLVMFGIGPIWAMMVGPRFVRALGPPAHAPQRHRARTSRSR